MNTKTKKIFIISLIIVTIVSIVFVVLMFNRPGTQGDQSQEQGRPLLFGALRPRRQQAPEPVIVDQGSQEVVIDENNENDTPLGEQIPESGLSNTNQDYLTSIPFPQGTLTTVDGPEKVELGEVRLPIGPGAGGGTGGQSGRRNPACDNPALSSALRTQLCPDEIGTPNMNFELSKFVLNEEEQAELDRLTRNFARLAVYLRSSGDIEDLQASQTSYNQIAMKYNRLAKDTEVLVNSDDYKGSKIRERSFLDENKKGLGLRVISYIPFVGYPYNKSVYEDILDDLGANDSKRTVKKLVEIEELLRVR